MGAERSASEESPVAATQRVDSRETEQDCNSAAPSNGALTPLAVVGLQRTAGNGAVAALLGEGRSLRAPEPCSAKPRAGCSEAPELAVQRQLNKANPKVANTAKGASAASVLIPAFRVNLREIPLIKKLIETAPATIAIELLLRGELTFRQKGSSPSVSVDATGGIRVEAAKALKQFTSGLRINDINTKGVSVGTTLGTDLVTNEVRFTPPRRYSFICQAQYLTGAIGGLSVTGKVGYELRADVYPNAPLLIGKPAPKPVPNYWIPSFWIAVTEDALISAGEAILTVAEAALLLVPIVSPPGGFGFGTQEPQNEA